MKNSKKILILGTTLLIVSGCAGVGKDKARDTFGYEKSPCACKEDGFYFNGKWFEKRSV